MVLLAVLIASFAWPAGSHVDAPHQWIDAGAVDEFEVNEPVKNVDGKFYVVRLESGEFLALYERDPHLGCTVLWAAHFEFQGRVGWFRNPCHSETYDVEGNAVFGPQPRGMDRFHVEISGDRVRVDTNRLICGPRAPEGTVCP